MFELLYSDKKITVKKIFFFANVLSCGISNSISTSATSATALPVCAIWYSLFGDERRKTHLYFFLINFVPK